MDEHLKACNNMAVARSDFAVGTERINGPVVRRLCLKHARVFAYVVKCNEKGQNISQGADINPNGRCDAFQSILVTRDQFGADGRNIEGMIGDRMAPTPSVGASGGFAPEIQNEARTVRPHFSLRQRRPSTLDMRPSS
jgi:hypothetical protein